MQVLAPLVCTQHSSGLVAVPPAAGTHRQGCCNASVRRDGQDIASLPLIERKALLKPLIVGFPGLQFNDHEVVDGELIRKHACELGFEGVVTKTAMHRYARETGASGANPSASIARSVASDTAHLGRA